MAEDKDIVDAGEALKPRSFLRRLGRFVVRLAIWVVGFFVFVLGGAWLWFESSSSDVVLAQKAVTFLEEGLGRDVSIGDLSLRPGLPVKLVVRDVRLSNAEGTTREDQASLSRIELKLSLRSLLRGKVRISDVRLIDPLFVLEILPDGDGIRTNLPKWLGPKSESDKELDLDIDTVEIVNGTFELIDHRHDLGVIARRIEGRIEPDLADLDDPRGSADLVIGAARFRSAKIEFPPIHLESRARFEEKVLWVERFHGEGNAWRLTARGPITSERIDLDATLFADLEKLREPLGLDAELSGLVDARGGVFGLYEDVAIEGEFEVPKVVFDVYGVTDLRGTFNRIEKGFEVRASEGKIAGGTVSGRYAAMFREGEPRNTLEIRHDNVAMEEVLAIWGIDDVGLLARGAGELRLTWDDGPPVVSGSAALTADPQQRTGAKVGIPVSGRVAYRMAEGALHFEPLRVASESTSIDLGGAVGLTAETLDLKAAVESTSFSDVDQLWANVAHALGQEDWELLGIAGRGTIDAGVTGAMDEPMVDIEVHADGFMFGDLNLERADGRVVFDGVRQELIFDNARFENGEGELVVRDRIGLLGEEIELALGATLHDWDTRSILDFLELDFPVRGLASGTVVVAGRPSAGRASFSPLEIRSATSTIKLSGDVAWTPEEKGLSFNLDVGLVDVSIETVAGVLDLGSDLPLSGDTTGTVHLEGPLTDVAGAGSVTVSRGTILGEPVDMIATDLVISEGVFRLKNLDIRMPAGFVKGEAKIDFAQDRFGYVIESSEIDIEKLQGYPSVRNVLTGKLIVLSSGAGTIEDPEIVLDARIKDAVLLEIPVSEPGVSLYATLRNGEFALQGAVGSTLSVEGSGLLDIESGAIDGNLSASISNIAKMMQRFEKRTGVKTSGNAELSLSLAGWISPIDRLVIDGKIEEIDLEIGEHRVRTAEPARLSLRDGTFSVDSFRMLVGDQTFTSRGTVSLVSGELALKADGLIQAGLLAVVMPDLRATGDIAISLDIGGTLEDPSVEGTADIRGADFRIQGFPQAFREVRSTLVLSGDVIEIDSFSARLGGGVVSAGGRIEFDEGTLARVRVNMQGREVDLRLSPGLTVAGGFDLVLVGNPSERMLLNGEASLTKVLYSRDIELGAAIVDFIVSRRAKVESVVQAWEGRTSLNIEVDARDAIRVRNNLARITGSADVTISGTLAQPVMIGEASFDEGGIVELNNVDYRLVNGTVNFQNPFRIDPYIDLTAEGRYRNEYDVTIVLTGTPDALQMSVASDPPIADLSILNVFGIATANTSGSVNTRDAVESAGSSIIDSSLGTLLGSRLTFADNLRLEGITGPEPRVTIEKSISDDVRAIVTYTMNDAGDNIEVIEWQVSPRFIVQVTRDSTKDDTYFINAIDVSFSRRFGGQW